MSFRKDSFRRHFFAILFFSLSSKVFFGTAFTLGTCDLGHLYLVSPPIKAATECNSLAPYRHLKKTMHILNTVRHFSVMVLMRRSYLIAKTLILYRKAISLMEEIKNSQVPFDILFLNAIKNATKLDKTKL